MSRETLVLIGNVFRSLILGADIMLVLVTPIIWWAWYRPRCKGLTPGECRKSIAGLIIVPLYAAAAAQGSYSQLDQPFAWRHIPILAGAVYAIYLMFTAVKEPPKAAPDPQRDLSRPPVGMEHL